MVKRYEEWGSEVGIDKMKQVWMGETIRKIEKNVPSRPFRDLAPGRDPVALLGRV
jgi:hypothetical protein